MYKKPKYAKTSLRGIVAKEGERIETKVARITKNGEAIGEGAKLVYLDRNEGVKAGYDIRTDRFEVAIEAHDKIEKSYKAKREKGAQMRVEKGGDDGKPVSNSGDNQKVDTV